MSDQLEVVSTVESLRDATKRLSNASKEVFKMARMRASTERDYRTELSKQIMKLRNEGVQATLISDIARGNVADLKFERDLAHELHRSAMSSISAIKTEVQSWQSIIKIMNEV